MVLLVRDIIDFTTPSQEAAALNELNTDVGLFFLGGLCCIIGFLFKRTLDGIEYTLKVIQEDVQEIKITQAQHEVRLDSVKS